MEERISELNSDPVHEEISIVNLWNPGALQVLGLHYGGEENR